MQTKSEKLQAEVSKKSLWKWTGVSAVLHAGLIAGLCGFSYWGFHKSQVAAKAKAAAEEIAARKAEAADVAKVPPATPKPVATAPKSEPAVKEAQAEKILGIDKVATPEETPKSPFSGNGDDLLKDLK